MGDDERRRYPRYAQYLPVRLKQGGKEVELVTSDISRTGAFVVTDSPRLDRELLKLSLELPDGEEVDLMGMVSRRIIPTDNEEEEKPGMGINFFAMSESVERRLKELIQSIPDEDLVDLDPRKPPSDRPLPIRRQHVRYLCRFLVRLKDRERLREFYSQDISAGGTFVNTPVPHQVNPEVELVLVHPQPPHEEFPISGRVVRVVEGPTIADRGVAIEFARLPAEAEASLLAFIETGVNYMRKSDEARADRVQILQRAVEAVGDSPVALANLGHALLHEIETADALAAFEKAVGIDAECLPAHRGLFKVYAMLDDLERAQQQLEIIRRLEGEQAAK